METVFGTIYLDPVRDAKMAKVLVQDAQELQDVVSLIEEGEIVVDAGAYIGSFSVAAAARGAKVYAFEPNPESIERLTQNSDGKDITVFPIGLGREEMRGALDINRENPSNTSFVAGDDIQVERMDSMTTHADFVKIDVEGMEPDVLEGMGSISPHTLYIEIFEKMLWQHGNTISDIEPYLTGYKKFIFFRGSWYQVPSLYLLLWVLNPGRYVGSHAVLNVLATKKEFSGKPFWSLICEKYF